MPCNIEIKARCNSLSNVLAILKKPEEESGFKFEEIATFTHEDTYFKTERGLAKLRVVNPGMFQAQCELLIYHRSARESGPRLSNWQSLRPSHSVAESVEIKDLLSLTFGVDTTVTKIRSLYMFENVRIHLDSVDGLGDFLEFEALFSDDAGEQQYEERGKKTVKKLMDLLSISSADLIAESYYHLMKEKEAEMTGPWRWIQPFLDIFHLDPNLVYKKIKEGVKLNSYKEQLLLPCQ